MSTDPRILSAETLARYIADAEKFDALLNGRPNRILAMGEHIKALGTLLQELVHQVVGGECEIAGDNDWACRSGSVAIRWEDGFIDSVCDRHAESAKERGALVIYPKQASGDTFVSQGGEQ
jgi:hypothetical protein